jgi:leader peptidase (prepilin peptidase)/N-methyltransferase
MNSLIIEKNMMLDTRKDRKTDRRGREMWEYIIRILIGLFLVIVTIQDIKWKKIRVGIVFIAGICMCICIPFCSVLSVMSRMLGLSLGLGLMLLSKATGGKIGIGDGLVLAVTGIGLGIWANIELFALALAMAAVFSIGLLVLRRADRKKAIPFMPFLLVAYLLLSIPI